MKLQAAFELELSSLDATLLSRLRALAIQQLKAATTTHRHPWHTGVVCTVGHDKPRVRTVVLRAVDDSPLMLRFHTDVRSTKVRQLRENAELEWLFYEPTTRIQLRVGAKASVLNDGDAWDAAWKQTSLSSRRCYLGPQPPSSTADSANHNLPEQFLNRDPSLQESEAGRANFAIVKCFVHSMEWLFLRHAGHLRCAFTEVDGNWTETWIAP